MNLTYATTASGINAPGIWHELGWKPVFHSEIDPWASAVLRYREPDVPNLGDMLALDPEPWRGKVDVFCAGTPCQAFSGAGLRGSLDDDRGNLTLKFAELVHGIDPKVAVWENVPGVLNTKDNAFGYFLAGLVGETDTALFPSERARREWERKGVPVRWANAGMVIGPRRSASWRVLDAQYFGLAQRRRRVFVVSFRTGDGINPGAVLFEPESLRRRTPPSIESECRDTRRTGCCAEESGVISFNWQSGGMCWLNPSPIVDALHKGQIPAVVQDGRARRLMPIEEERLQGFPDDYTKYGIVDGETVEISDTQRYNLLSNSMARNVVLWIGKRIEYVIAEYDRSTGLPDNIEIRKRKN